MPTCPDPKKTKFTSERQAKAALRSIRHPHGQMQAYRCGAHWHIGHGHKTRSTPKTLKRRTR